MSKVIVNGNEYDITRETILNDVKEDNVALKYLFKYLPDLVTDDLLEEIIAENKYVVRFIPKERLPRKIVMSIVVSKDSRCLFNYVPKELIDEEMEEIIVTTYTYEAIKRYLEIFEDRLTIEKIKKILTNITNKSQKLRLRDRYIPKKFLTDEVLELIPEYKSSAYKYRATY